jgi:uncharacterized integral membrane protein (TIGR00698 family)
LANDSVSGQGAYFSPEWDESLDSLEGVPDIFEPHLEPSPTWHWLFDGLTWFSVMLPGLALALGLAWIGWYISENAGRLFHYNAGASPISPVTLAVALGLLLRNTIGLPKTYEPGLRLCMRSILRIGIVIMGLTLSIFTVGHSVFVALPVMVGCIAVAMISVSLIARWMGISRRLGTLIAVGTSICGVSAIMATAPVIEADENETSYAAACITIFGLLAMITYPFAAHHLFALPKEAGMFFGTAIHDMSQATAAGLAYAQQYHADDAFHTAVSTKLVRNLFMSLLIPLAGILYHRGSQGTKRVQQKWHQIVPMFVVGFLIMACVRSLGDTTGASTGRAFGLFEMNHWNMVGSTARFLVPWMLAMAMGAVGLGTGLAKLRNLGWKPFSIGFAAALLVGVTSTLLVKVMSHLVHLQ